MMGEAFFAAIVGAYRQDFHHRGLDTPDDVGILPNGYIDPDQQEWLFIPPAHRDADYVAANPSGVANEVWIALATWATLQRAAALQNGEPTRSVHLRQQAAQYARDNATHVWLRGQTGNDSESDGNELADLDL